ncbi:hypothetical protein [Streptomyces sp. NPDC050428]|uniref:hypothetical protein n=1 Tax=Streptomyces sp. NPDC050428 TaxID=3155757 RepID=UPI00341E7312
MGWCEDAVDATGDAIADTASGIYMGTGEVFYGLVSNVPDTASYVGWLVDGGCWNGGAGAPGCDYSASFDQWAAGQVYNTDKWTYTLPSMVADLAGRKPSAKPSPGVMPKKKTPPAPKKEKYGDSDGYISQFKAPQSGKGQHQYDNGYLAADSPSSSREPGMAYFGRKYSLVEEKYARYEKQYEGSSDVEVPIPTSAFDRRNSYDRVWHR